MSTLSSIIADQNRKRELVVESFFRWEVLWSLFGTKHLITIYLPRHIQVTPIVIINEYNNKFNFLPLHFLARFINTNTYLGDRIKIVPKISRMRKKYSETLPYGHLGNVVTSLLWPLFSAYCGLLVTVLMGFHCKQVIYWPRSVRMEILCPQAIFRTARGLPSPGRQIT